MSSVMHRHSARIWLGVVLSVVLSGCAVAGKSMSIDSTSRMPWFGLELKERSRKSSEPKFRSIGLDKGNKSRVEILGLFGGKSAAAEPASSPAKSLALPTTDQELVMDSIGSDEPAEIDFR